MRYRARNGVRVLSLGSTTVTLNKDGTVPASAPQSLIKYFLRLGVLEPVKTHVVKPKKEE